MTVQNVTIAAKFMSLIFGIVLSTVTVVSMILSVY